MISLTNNFPQPDSFRTTQQISEMQIKLGMSVETLLREIETAQNKINAVKQEAANRWRKVEGLDSANRHRLAGREASTRAREIMDDVVTKIDDQFLRIREMYQEIERAKVFYPGKLQFLMNATIMHDKRAQYAATLTLAGPMELAGYAAYAIGVQDMVMAAAVIQANDALPSNDRRFASAALAERMNISAWESVQASFKLAYNLWRQAEMIVRAFKAGKPSPIDTIRLALLNGRLDEVEEAEE